MWFAWLGTPALALTWSAQTLQDSTNQDLWYTGAAVTTLGTTYWVAYETYLFNLSCHGPTPNRDQCDKALYLISWDGTSVSAPVTLPDPGSSGAMAYYQDPSIAASGSRLHVLVAAPQGGGCGFTQRGIVEHEYNPSTGMVTTRQVTPVDCALDAGEPVVRYDAHNDRIRACWQRSEQSDDPLDPPYDIQCADRAIGGNWGAVTTIATSAADTADEQFPALALKPENGQRRVMWLTELTGFDPDVWTRLERPVAGPLIFQAATSQDPLDLNKEQQVSAGIAVTNDAMGMIFRESSYLQFMSCPYGEPLSCPASAWVLDPNLPSNNTLPEHGSWQVHHAFDRWWITGHLSTVRYVWNRCTDGTAWTSDAMSGSLIGLRHGFPHLAHRITESAGGGPIILRVAEIDIASAPSTYDRLEIREAAVPLCPP
jgi:hypothetical protein